VEDRWILSRLGRVTARTNQLLEDYQFGEAERQICDFVWGDFCDWYIEIAKIRMREGADPSPMPILMHVLETSLRLLHPFMPFITEELWQSLPAPESRAESVMIALYPQADDSTFDAKAEREMGAVIEIIRSIRNARAEHKVEAAQWVEAQVHADDKAAIERHAKAIETLARARPLKVTRRTKSEKGAEKALVIVLADADVVLPMSGMVDLDAQGQRLEKEIEECGAFISRLETRLADEAFLSKAPPAVVQKEQERLSELRDRLKKLQERLSQVA
jgi:valyl-tRNA synthetase